MNTIPRDFEITNSLAGLFLLPVVVNGTFIVLGGSAEYQDDLATMEVWNGEEWSFGPGLTRARSSLCATNYNESFIVTGASGT